MDTISAPDMTERSGNSGLARFSLKFYYTLIGSIILVILLIVPAFKSNYITYIVTQMLFFAYLGQAWNIMCGYTGQLSFGHAAFFGIGAYTSSILFLRLGLTPWVGMFLGGGLAFLVGLGLGSVAFRSGVRGVFFALVTLTTGELFRLLALFFESLTGGAEGILLPFVGNKPLLFSFGVHQKYMYYYTMLAMLLGCTYLAYWIKKIRFGYYLTAIRENEDAAETLGINAVKLKIIAIGISAGLTALGGTFYVQLYQHFEPEEVFGPMRSFEIIFPVIVGGGGNVLGPPLGAFVLQFFEETTRTFMPASLHGVHRMIYGIILVLMIMYLPSGLIKLLEDWKDRVVKKYGIKTHEDDS